MRGELLSPSARSPVISRHLRKSRLILLGAIGPMADGERSDAMQHDLEETRPWQVPPEAVQPGQRRAWVTILVGNEAGKVIPLEPGRTAIGRSEEADVVIDDELVSRIHTEILTRDDGSATIRDCESTNGTMVGSRGISSTPRELRDGARIHIGGAVVLRFSSRDRIEEHFESQLYDSATRDSLTGAYNKRFLQERLEQCFELSQRHERPMALIAFDLDNFKEINDRHGHPAGDQVLQDVVTAVAEDLRSGETLCRFGGDELVVLLHLAALEEALVVGERLRRTVARTITHWKGHTLRVTGSFGIASTSRGKWGSSTQLFAEADENLYRAKEAGRNRVCGSCRS
jgi:two-component system, cell cycle response regulator